MTETIIVAIISLAGTLGGSYLGVRASNKLVNFRLDKLEIKVDEHNNVIKRTFILEEQVKVANHRISDIEEREKKHE